MSRAALLAFGLFLHALAAADLAAAGENNGRQLFASMCSACHGEQGQGTPGLAPPLAGRSLNAARTQIISTVLAGLSGEITVGENTYDGVMPSFADSSDRDLAAIVNFVIGLGMSPPGTVVAPVTPAHIAEDRKSPLTAPQLRARRSSEFSRAPAAP